MTLALLVFAATYLLMLRLQQYRPWVAPVSYTHLRAHET